MEKRTFTVEGRGEFPLDMLRYDECGFATDRDVVAAGGSATAPVRLVTLSFRTDASRHTPTIARWESFGWRILGTEKKSEPAVAAAFTYPVMPRYSITPGPWVPCRSHEDENGPMWNIDADDRAEYDAKPYVSIKSIPTGRPVASSHDLFEFNAADAKAIAKVPELLEVAMWAEAALGYLAACANVVADRPVFKRRHLAVSKLLNEIRS